MNSVAEDILMHYGIKRRSGRYPWGSGEDPYQHGRDFLGRIEELKKEGWEETPENIRKEFGLTTTQYRTEKSIATGERRALNVARAKSLKEDGLSDSEIGRQLGVNESTVRSWFNSESEARMNQAKATAEFLRKQVDEKGMIDVGTGVERELSTEFQLNISKEQLNKALYLLEREGYPVYKGGIPQATNPGQQTNQRVLCKPGTEHKEIYDYDRVHSIKDYISRDGGETFEKKFHYPTSIDSKRVKVLLADEIGPDGEPGVAKDGLIQLRRVVPDLSLGESRYSQVRIMVDGDKYLKGMAVYSDNMPDGIDVIFNSNKKTVADAYKKIKDDPDNPFGSLIKDAEQGGQYWYNSKTGKRCKSTDPDAKLGAINKRADEGDWTDWKDALPSQFLAKQNRTLAKKQLDLAKADKLAEFDEICSLTNPTVKKHLLEKFADGCDSAAVRLQAAALPGQKYHVIIPVNSLKDNEVYAPGYPVGTKLALIRYPHAGTFEIPICTVTHKNKTSEGIIGKDSIDAICVNSKVAERLSGADFDGDTVMCIPTHDRAGKVKITSTDRLKDLIGFDNKALYQYDKKTVDPDGTEHYFRNGKEFKVMRNTGTQMGVISNLITDMTLADAGPEKIARAVKHSMVVIDAEKHKLDYKQSEIDNDIESLRKEYQRYVDANGRVHYGGASTILSRSKGETSVPKRQGSPKINIKGKDWYDPSKPEGSLIYNVADDLEYTVSKVNKRTGQVVTTTKHRTQQSTRMRETDDANTLVSDARHPIEVIYADYANSMKALANKARLEMVSTGKIAYSASAKSIYQKEVDSLYSKLNTALLNSGRERQAQRKANAELEQKIKAKMEANPGMTRKQAKKAIDSKKTAQQALSKYRNEVGSVSRRDRSIEITDREWEAIQAGAIHENKLKQILNNADVDSLRQRATPRATSTLSQAKVNRIKAMSNSNYSLSEIASALGVSTTTVSKYLKGGDK